MSKKSITYRSWIAMKSRCLNKEHIAHSAYRGRLCERWQFSYESFVADMGERPSRAHSIDRIDVNGMYEPGNCRWATSKEQQRNKRSNKFVVVDGETITAAEAAERFGLPPTLVYNRLRKGWPIEKVLSRVDHRSTGGRLAVG